MTNKIVVHKGRTNVFPVNLGYDVTGETFTAQARVQPDVDSTLIAPFVVAVVDAATGRLSLTMDNTVTEAIEVSSGYMDIKRVTGGEPIAVFDRPLEVEFRGVVTA